MHHSCFILTDKWFHCAKQASYSRFLGVEKSDWGGRKFQPPSPPYETLDSSRCCDSTTLPWWTGVLLSALLNNCCISIVMETCNGWQQAIELVCRLNLLTPLTTLISACRTLLQNECASVALKNVQNAHHKSWRMPYSYKYVLSHNVI